MSRPGVDTPPPAAPAARRFVYGPWLPAALGLICFLNSVGNDFTYDDRVIVRDNPRIRSLTNLREVWLSDWWQPQAGDAEELDPRRERDRLYRPLTMYTFAVDYALGRLRPGGYHLTNVLLHGLACLLVWQLARRLCADAAIAACAAALFAVHPVHCEAVANLVGRAEILAAVWLLLGLLALMPRPGTLGWHRTALAAAAFLAGLLAKETAVCYPLLALLVLLVRPADAARRGGHWWAVRGVILLLPLVAYFPLRYAALGGHLIRDAQPSIVLNPLLEADALRRCGAAFAVLGHYARLTVLPRRLSCDYGARIIDLEAEPSPMAFLGAATAAGLLLALWGFRRRSELWRLLAGLAALGIASYALISNTVLLIGVAVGERLFYWPSVPILILVAALIVAGWRRMCVPGGALVRLAPLLRIAGLLLLGALALRSVVRNSDWANNERLFTVDLRTYPESVHVRECLARVLIGRAGTTDTDRQRPATLAQVEEVLQEGQRRYPNNAAFLQLRGRVRGMLGDEAGAIRYFESALRLDPTDTAAKKLLVQLRDPDGEKDARVAALQAQLVQRPEDVQLLVELGELQLELGQHAAALTTLEQAAALAPRNADVLELFGEVLFLHSDPQRTVRIFERVLELDPQRWEAHVNLAVLLAAEKPAVSLRHARAAHRLNPGDLRTNVNLAEALALNGETAAALERFRLIERGLAESDPTRAAVTQRIRELEARH
ncbi:MAG: tetratricopeptide repeat protein [Planctomycetes bacterium]|nr:tetratricopeptide repeat protein [Planctomycetota bacterium]